MKASSLTANILREFMKKHGAYKYRGKKVTDMTDAEVFQKCHWFCEENNLNTEHREFVDNALEAYRHCSYLDEFIDESQCLNLQIIACAYKEPSSCFESTINKAECKKCCFKCEYGILIKYNGDV